MTPSEKISSVAAHAELEFAEATFPVRLDLPHGEPDLLEHARQAVQEEYRESSKWKRLQCRQSRRHSKTDAGTIYVLEIGHAVEFDWTWEGATAFRPLDMKHFVDNPRMKSQHSDDPRIDGSMIWTGEILEVDDIQGLLYVAIEDTEYPPVKGSFFVRPFEFLATLNTLYNLPAFESIRGTLTDRLFASEGFCDPNMPPRPVADFRPVGLPAMLEWWRTSWSCLWGPPGTGKTYTMGEQVASVLSDASERILVVSTTNRATDAAAISIGRACQSHAPALLSAGSLLRIGKGASLPRFESAELTDMLRGTETDYLERIGEFVRLAKKSKDPSVRAALKLQARQLQDSMRDQSSQNFLNAYVRVVVSTSFRSTLFLRRDEIKNIMDQGCAPFTTLFIDEAGLISRAAVAALSLMASRRIVLVGDSKQLAPISKISRLLPTNQMTWLAKSGLSHLESISTKRPGVHVLREQHRMHPDICSVVSDYQYEGYLVTAPGVAARQVIEPTLLQSQPKAIWYVMDDDAISFPSIRAERGPSNRSWIRPATRDVLKKLFLDETLAQADGLFISPFAGQAKDIASFFSECELSSWSSSTVHSQQGAEAEIVIFDTVNAGSHSWPYDDWRRLVNVALSRARQSILVLASRSEMNEPYLRPLLKRLAPRVLRRIGSQLVWEVVPMEKEFVVTEGLAVRESNSLGYQLKARKAMTPVLSYQQERLCRLELDGKPRLVRGVAGSGKTMVLAHWLMQTLHRLPKNRDTRIWAVFANRSLQSLIAESIEAAWLAETKNASFPWDRVSLMHIRDVLVPLLQRTGNSMNAFEFDYNAAAASILDRTSEAGLTSCCDAMFIDEAQDLGPSALKLLTYLVHQSTSEDPNSRSVNIFYDNAQNIYGRPVPKWSDIGLDMRGRSSVMKESFRSTQPITEFAINVLYRLQSMVETADHKELLSRGLIEKSQDPDGATWWNVRFNQIAGPKPKLFHFESFTRQIEGVAAYCRYLIVEEHVQPKDICLLYIGEFTRKKLEEIVGPMLLAIGAELSVQTSQVFMRPSHCVLATTPNSFKGYDSEIVIIPAVDQYVSREKGILSHSLYVAMTRARSILSMFTSTNIESKSCEIQSVLKGCLSIPHSC